MAFKRTEPPPPPLLLLLLRILLSLVMILSPWAIIGGAAVDYYVGGTGVWDVPANPNFYQQWAYTIAFNSNDTISFSYTHPLHDVWQFQDQASFSSCDFSGGISFSAGATLNGLAIRLTPLSPASTAAVYIGSSVGLDCVNGMRFGLTYYTCLTCATPAPPPPVSVVPDPPPPPPPVTRNQASPPPPSRSVNLSPPPPPGPASNGSGSGGGQQSESSKTAVPAAAIAVPVVLIVVLGAGVVVFCCVRRARARARASANMPTMMPPGSPLPSFEKIKLPAAAAAYAPGGGGPNSSSASSSTGLSASGTGLSSSSSSYASSFAARMPGFFGPPQAPVSSSGHTAGSGAGSSRGSSSGNSGGRRASRADGSRIFSYAELCAATHDFAEACLIGKGGFGVVYRGVLPDGSAVAIKGSRHLDKGEDKQQLLNEVAVLSKLNHRNLVRLLGWCADADHDALLLVYEFVPNGTLQEHLRPRHQQQHQPQPQPALDWSARLRIAIQAAEALKYLHVQVTPPVFHRDVKSANILLDAARNAKVADFGMSRPVHDLDATHVSTMVKGTTGYLDPDYFYTGQLTDRSDVYSYGVVLLELLTARKPLDPARPRGQHNLAEAAVPVIVAGGLADILDPRLLPGLDAGDKQAVQRVAMVAVACLVHDSQSRPSMSQVVEMLHKIKGSDLRAEDFFAGNPNAHGGGGGGGGGSRPGSAAIPGFNIQLSSSGTGGDQYSASSAPGAYTQQMGGPRSR